MININLIAERRARKIREGAILRLSTIGVICMLAFVILLNMIRLLQINEKDSKISSLRQDINTREKQVEKLQVTKQEIEEKEPVVKLLQKVRISEKSWIAIMCDFSRVIPDDVYIQTFAVDASPDKVNINVAGMASDESKVADFMEILHQKTRWAEKPNLSQVGAQDDKEGARRTRFNLSIPVRGLQGGEL